ncbi:MAG TPA: sulfatase-like hydrolase/transferase, partial [Bacteroidales bacterium]|nr:sulfatase-like hydrolase/transferase [Bacteroidales bacterium]
YGFQLNIGGSHAGHPRSYYPPYKNVEIEDGSSEYLTDLVMEKAVEFLDTVRQPFFLNYSPYAVHTPIQPVDSLIHNYQNKPSFQGQQNPDYATMVENLDRNIGWLLSTLKEKEVFDNTFIIFTSDNGGLYGVTMQKPLRAGKGSYYEGGIREPFLFVWKGEVDPNLKSDIPITNMDIFPTLLNVAGVDGSKYELDGTNLLPLLQGKTQQLDRKQFWHFPIYLQAYNVHKNETRDSLFRTRPGSVVRYGDWKLHYYFEDDGIELYNLANDIGERNNLANENPEKTEEMLTYLEQWWKETNAPIPQDLNPDYEE